MNTRLFSSIIVALTLVSTNLKAQIPVNYVFAQDSLKGFDEQAAHLGAMQNNCFGQEYKSFIYKAKREFINHKYHLKHVNEIVWKTAKTTTVQPSCSNIDFEIGSFASWSLTKGSNSNSTTMAGCCPGTFGAISQVINGAGNDPIATALSLTSPFGGTKIAKINDDNYDYSVERITQTFAVTSSNAIFQFAYAGVLEAAGHTCTDQPFMNVSVKDSADNVLACPKIVIVAPSTSCTQPASVTAGWIHTTGSSFSPYYHNWEIKTIDLSAYIGSAITIQITVGDCTQGGHYGYGYFDCRCLPLELDLNGTIYDATPQTPINVSTCGSASASINAPTGLGPYVWNGPAGSGVTSVTTQSMSTSTPGTYTLDMNPVGGCTAGSVTKYVILNVTSNPTVTNVAAAATCTNATGSGTVYVASGSAPFTYNWFPAASTDSIGVGLSPGTDYTVNVVDTFGCQHSTIISIPSFTDAPTYTINPLSANLTCFSPSLTVTAITATNTTAVWTHTATTDFDVNTPGTYSCIVTNTISSCTATVPITITTNTVAPVATFTALCNGSNVSLNATSTSGIALGWLAPTSPPSPLSNPGTSTATGIFTLTATNLSTGCKQTYTLESLVPNLNIVTTPGNNLTCVTQSLQSTASSSTSSVTIIWFDGASTTTVNPLPITASGSYTATAQLAGGCSTQSVITITTNTAVGATINSLTTVLSCITKTITLTANQTTSGVYNYTWTPSVPTATNNTYNVSTIGTYSLDILNSTNGCTATAVTTTITIDTIAPVATYTIDCTSFPAILNGNSSSGISLNWLTPTIPPTPVSNLGTSSASGVFTLTATNPTTGCKTTYTVESLVPSVNIVSSSATNSITCSTQNIQATATSSATTDVITWLDGTSTSTVNPYTITASGNYTANVQALGGCITQSVIAITTNTAVGVNISSSSTIVPCLTNSLALNANQLSAGVYSYMWMPSTPTETNSTYFVSNAGTYAVVVLNATNGCTATATQAVTHETITASFIADPYQGLMPLPVSFTNTSSGNPINTDYNWDLANGTTYTNISIVGTVYDVQGNYPVILTATYGFCQDTAVRIIKVDLVSFFKVANVFTPNGDGKNDVFTFDAVNMGEITFTVFDRWGLKMFESTSTGNIRWDGKNKGDAIIAEGTYFYIIKANGLDDVKYDLQGTINVFR